MCKYDEIICTTATNWFIFEGVRASGMIEYSEDKVTNASGIQNRTY